MSATTLFTVLIVLVALERVAELIVSQRNLRWSSERGGQEFGRGHYPVMVVLHLALLVGALVEVHLAGRPMIPALAVPMLVLVLGAQALRWWCITSLGPRWNTRVVIVPGLPRVTGGPYAWLSHPNYVAVVVEGVALPLVGSAWVTALVFTVAERCPAHRADPHRGCGAEPAAGRCDVIDLIVAGGGPVGLATAITAAMADLEVVIVEPRVGIIDKACGEGLMPQALAQLNTLGIDPDGVDLAGIRYLSGSRSAQARFSAGPGRGVRRTTLHDAMLGRALDVGVSILPGTVTGVEQTADRVHAAGVDARYLVGADGLHSSVRRAVGLAARPAGVRRFGLRQHFRVAPWSDLVEVHWLPGQEVYVTPVSHDTVGVAVLGPSPLDLQSAIASLPTLAESPLRVPLPPARCEGPDRCANPPPRGWPAGCCWSATRPATSTPSPGRVCGSDSPRLRQPSTRS